MLLACKPFSRPIEVLGWDGCADMLAKVFIGWEIGPWMGDAVAPAIRIDRRDERITLDTPERRDDTSFYRETVNAVCRLMADIVMLHAHDLPGHFYFHGAAVAFAGGGILVPATGKGGKSTLTAALMAEGAAVFSDDIVAIGPRGQALSFGMAPRLRLPLPQSLGRDFSDFLAARAGLVSDRYQYVVPRSGEVAPRGTRADIRHIALLAREAHKVPAGLEEVRASDAVKILVLQTMRKAGFGPDTVTRLAALAGSARLWRVRYHDAPDAARLLREVAMTEGRVAAPGQGEK